MAENLEKLVDELSKLSVMDAAKLSKMLEEKWGVTAAAAAPVMMAAGGGGGAAPAEEKDSFDVVLVSGGANKIAVIKEVRTITGLGLKEAKDLVEKGGEVVKAGVAKADAQKMADVLKAAGATVELK